MDLKNGVVVIVAGFVWLMYLFDQIAVMSAIGLSSILWLIVAINCAMVGNAENEADVLLVASERDLM